MKKIIYEHLHLGTRKNGSRKSDRTNLLHEGIVSQIRNKINNFDNNYKVEYEKKIPCSYGNKFTIDILITDKSTNKIHTCILAKAFISSVQKNRANNANTSIGECVRILQKNPDVNLFFVTFIANETPEYLSGKLNRMENTNSSYIKLNSDILSPFKENVIKKIHFGTITYDVDKVNYNTKESFHNTLRESNIININTKSFNKSVESIFA